MTAWKKLLSLTLALALGAGLLTGCSKNEEKPYFDPETKVEMPVLTEDTFDLSAVEDPVLALTGIPGYAVMGTVGEYEITAAQMMYWLNLGLEMNAQQMQMFGITDMPWDREQDGKKFDQVLKEGAVETASFDVLLPYVAQKEGLEVVSEEEEAAMEAELKKQADELGGEELLDHMLWVQLLTLDQYRTTIRSTQSYAKLAEHYYGPQGTQAPTEEDMIAYAEDTMGAYNAKHILLATEDPATKEKLSQAEIDAQKAKAADLLEQIRSAQDPVAKFDELMKANSQDPGLATNPNGYSAKKGEMVPVFEQTALALDINGISDVVESDFGYHIIMRVPYDMEQLSAAYMSGMMQELHSQWSEEYKVTTNQLFDNLDVKQFYENGKVLKKACIAELEAHMPKAPEDLNAPAQPESSASSSAQAEG